MPDENDLIKLFLRHVVPIYFSFRKDSDRQNFFLSAFVLSVSSRWFLITAGHCIKCVEKLEKSGYEMTDCLLIDSMGVGATNFQAIRFLYHASHPFCLSDEYEFDYGIMLLSPYYIGLLRANNVKALDESYWKEQPSKAEFYLLLGVPSELVKVSSERVDFASTLHYVEALQQRPDGFRETNADLFYGKVKLGEDLNSIKGLSGGPIFSCFGNEKGEMRYWLAALQSHWLSDSHLIEACPIKLLGHFIEDVVGKNA